MNCDYLVVAEGRIKCRQCGCERAWSRDGLPQRNCKSFALTPPSPPRLSCIHRGEESRRVVCPTCTGGGVKVKAFACSILGECTLEKPAKGLAVCKSCRSCEPAPVGYGVPIWHRGLKRELTLEVPPEALPAELASLAGAYVVERESAPFEENEAGDGGIAQWWYWCEPEEAAVAVLVTAHFSAGAVRELRAAFVQKCGCPHPGCFIYLAAYEVKLEALGQVPEETELQPAGGESRLAVKLGQGG